MKIGFGVSLRAKITLALLVTGLVSAVLVGVIARLTFLQQFNRAIFDASFQAFSADVTAYIEEYGSLRAALDAEPYPTFVMRRRERVPAPNRTVGADSMRPGAKATVPAGGAAQRPGFVPPFHFLALDLEGKPVLGRGAEGLSEVTAELRAKARPIVVRGQLAAYAVPIEQRNLNPVDQTYLDAMQSAMAYGVAGASLIALALGFFFSGRLSANIRKLAHAIQAMRAGNLRQHVDVGTRDEIGFLGHSFNQMSEELAHSHDLIKQQASQLRELSIRDETTLLHNRRYFDDQAAIAYFQAQRYGRPFSVCVGDLDHFKQINDRFSHATGDAVLRHVGRILAASTRESDIVARYGGEEFVIAFPETPAADAFATCERIRRRIAEHPWHEIHPDLKVTVTFGIDADATRARLEQMVEAADAQLYEGKRSGRNRVVFVPMKQQSA
jgi:two-component system, cell cycle response regulator